MNRLAIAFSLLASAASAHSWYDSDCCSNRDCAPIPTSTVHLESGGYRVVLEPGDHFIVTKRIEKFFPFGDENLRPSGDGDWHACVIPSSGQTEYYTPGASSAEYIKCLYFPGAGA